MCQKKDECLNGRDWHSQIGVGAEKVIVSRNDTVGLMNVSNNDYEPSVCGDTCSKGLDASDWTEAAVAMVPRRGPKGLDNVTTKD